MKDYLPSLKEIVPNVIIILIGLTIWELVGSSITGALDKVKSKATA